MKTSLMINSGASASSKAYLIWQVTQNSSTLVHSWKQKTGSLRKTSSSKMSKFTCHCTKRKWQICSITGQLTLSSVQRQRYDKVSQSELTCLDTLIHVFCHSLDIG